MLCESHTNQTSASHMIHYFVDDFNRVHQQRRTKEGRMCIKPVCTCMCYFDLQSSQNHMKCPLQCAEQPFRCCKTQSDYADPLRQQKAMKSPLECSADLTMIRARTRQAATRPFAFPFLERILAYTFKKSPHVTKYCACHEKWLARITWNVHSTVRNNLKMQNRIRLVSQPQQKSETSTPMRGATRRT